MKIGEVVRRRRKALGYNLTDVAYAIDGYDPGNLSRFERGEQGIDVEKLHSISQVLGTTISSLYWELEQESGDEMSDETRLLYIWHSADDRGKLSIMRVAESQSDYQVAEEDTTLSRASKKKLRKILINKTGIDIYKATSETGPRHH